MPDAVAAVLWSGFGFGAGWVSCRIAMQSSLAENTNPKVRKFNLDIIRTVLGLVILVLLVLTSTWYYSTVTCQTEYNRKVSESLAQRADAQRREGQAQIELLTAATPADFDRETQEYLDAIAELERVRASSPIPAPPQCGDAW